MAAVMVPTTAKCPACSSDGRVVDGQDVRVLTCKGCGGLFTRADITEDVALALVRMHEPMLPNSSTMRYFDFIISGARRYRSHGWFDANTRQVVQWG